MADAAASVLARLKNKAAKSGRSYQGMISTVAEKVTPESWEIIEQAETSDLCVY